MEEKNTNVMRISTVIIIFVTTFAILSVVGFPKLIDTTPIQNPPVGQNGDDDDDNQTQTPPDKKTVSGFEKFASEEEFEQYLASASEQTSYYGGGRGGWNAIDSEMLMMESAMDIAVAPTAKGSMSDESGASPDRVSDTNVQVSGIDEPDIVKTNGTDIFISGENRYYFREPMPVFEMDGDVSIKKPDNDPGILTNIVKAFPPEALEEIGGIEEGGNLLLSEDNLIIFSGDKIYGFDVSDTTSPEKEWTISLEDNTQYSQARLYDGKIYLVTQKYIDRYDPCPIRPFLVGEETLEVRCVDIYHPSMIAPIDVTYTIATIDPKTGSMDIGVSFAGSYDSTVYMSENGLYVAYSYPGSVTDFFVGFFVENEDLFPKEIMARLKKLQEYDISDQAKLVEIEFIMEELERSLSGDERLKIENEFQNRVDSYAALHGRDLEQTDIVKISLSNFDIKDIGTVPGKLLNQFSLDEYDENLRVAVTIGSQNQLRWQYGIDIEEANDVYVLDKNMETIGSVTDLGLDEKIYSARFIGERGYLVTFKQIDPFFVLDLSDPTNPEVKGELKIPGFSSYLHPISENVILGIGREGSKVKMSLFDVSDPTNPIEASKYMLDEYWSEVQNTHHAFLQDSKHGVFFMPGNKGGYIFSYKDNDLKMVKAVSGVRARRAIYLDDYLYVIGDNKIVVLDESDWSRVNELKLSN